MYTGLPHCLKQALLLSYRPDRFVILSDISCREGSIQHDLIFTAASAAVEERRFSAA
jgi:hypothetical protein